MSRNRPHPVGLIVLLLGISALFAGCETFARHERRAPATNLKRIEVFRTNTKPPSQIQEMGDVSDEGTLKEQAEIEARFVSKARRAGADALIYDPIVKIGEEVKLFSATEDKYSFKATMVSYRK
jgi:hypothetical protein